MSIRRPGSPTYCAALPITPPGGCTSCCPGTGTRRRSGTPSPRKISPLLFLQTFLQITRLHAVSLRPRPDAYDDAAFFKGRGACQLGGFREIACFSLPQKNSTL